MSVPFRCKWTWCPTFADTFTGWCEPMWLWAVACGNEERHGGQDTWHLKTKPVSLFSAGLGFASPPFCYLEHILMFKLHRRVRKAHFAITFKDTCLYLFDRLALSTFQSLSRRRMGWCFGDKSWDETKRDLFRAILICFRDKKMKTESESLRSSLGKEPAVFLWH